MNQKNLQFYEFIECRLKNWNFYDIVFNHGKEENDIARLCGQKMMARKQAQIIKDERDEFKYHMDAGIPCKTETYVHTCTNTIEAKKEATRLIRGKFKIQRIFSEEMPNDWCGCKKSRSKSPTPDAIRQRQDFSKQKNDDAIRIAHVTQKQQLQHTQDMKAAIVSQGTQQRLNRITLENISQLEKVDYFRPSRSKHDSIRISQRRSNEKDSD